MQIITPDVEARLNSSQNIWLASVRPDGRPHLAPVWYAWLAGNLYVCIEPTSIKGQNIAYNPRVALSLEEGLHPIILEGVAAPVPEPWPEEVLSIFLKKYEWDLMVEARYTQLLEIVPEKCLAW
jgi:PPOX class probable F420-dependent enzyme